MIKLHYLMSSWKKREEAFRSIGRFLATCSSGELASLRADLAEIGEVLDDKSILLLRELLYGYHTTKNWETSKTEDRSVMFATAAIGLLDAIMMNNPEQIVNHAAFLRNKLQDPEFAYTDTIKHYNDTVMSYENQIKALRQENAALKENK